MHNIFMRNYTLTSAQGGCAQSATEHQRKSAYPEAEHSNAINHKVHGHHMSSIFLLRKSCFNESKTSLHKHNEESSDQGPHDVNSNLIVAICCTNRLYRRCQFAYAGANGGNGCVLGIYNAIKDFYCHRINITECSCFCARWILCHNRNYKKKAKNNC